MTVKQLQEAFDTLRISPNAYSLKGVLSEGYVLDCYYGIMWVTYCIERDQQSQYMIHASESDACEYFLQWVSHDKTSYQNYKSTYSLPHLPAKTNTAK